MNVLMPIEIRGLGTPDVESFPSYIHRLAYIHKVTVSSLLKRVVRWYKLKYKDRDVCFNNNSFAGDLSVYVRPNQGTYDLVTIFSEAVGNRDLLGTTFTSLYKTSVRTVGIFSKEIRWCPFCMKISELNGDDGYFKLMWFVESITHCHEHDTLLIDKCTVCGESQGGYGYKIAPGKCQKCGAPLSSVNLEDVQFKSSWNVQGPDMMNLVEYISKNPREIFPENSVREVITKEFDKAWKNNTEYEFWKIIPKDDCIGISEGYIPITIKRARALAYRFGVDLIDLLRGDISKSTIVLNPRWTSELPEDMQPTKKNRSESKDIVLSKVHEAMGLNQGNPKPLRFYASLAQVSVGYLHYHFPILAKRIILVFLKWKEDEKSRKKHEAYSEVLKVIINHNGASGEFSKKATLRNIIDQTGLPKDVVRQAINIIYDLVLKSEI